MTTINKNDIRKVAQATCNWPKNCGWSTVVLLDIDDGQLWTSDIQDTNLVVYQGRVVTVCRTSKHISAKKLTEYITELFQDLGKKFEII